MAVDTVIHNVEELAEAFGIDPAGARPDYDLEAQIERRLYKATACGAWIRFGIPLAIPTVVRVACSDSIFGPCAVAWQVGDETTWHSFTEETPPEIVSFFGGYPQPVFRSEHRLLRLAADCGSLMAEVKERACNVVALPNPDPYQHVLLTTLNIDSQNRGIRIGSIVEGSDTGTESHELFYPFTEGELDEAIADIEYQAEQLWLEANGSEDEED